MVDGHQGLSLQTEAYHELLSHPQHIHSSSTFPHHIAFNSTVAFMLLNLSTCKIMCCELLCLGLGMYVIAFQKQDSKACFKN